MTWDNPEEEEPELGEDDEWQLFASAGYASAESLTDSGEHEQIGIEKEEVDFAAEVAAAVKDSQ